jgi:hypothetical protein
MAKMLAPIGVMGARESHARYAGGQASLSEHNAHAQGELCRRKSRLVDLHWQRQVVVVIGLVYCPLSPSVHAAYQEFAALCRQVPHDKPQQTFSWQRSALLLHASCQLSVTGHAAARVCNRAQYPGCLVQRCFVVEPDEDQLRQAAEGGPALRDLVVFPPGACLNTHTLRCTTLIAARAWLSNRHVFFQLEMRCAFAIFNV